MKQKHQIEREVEETLNSLNGIQRAEPRPFLFTRVQARLDRPGKNAWETITSYVARPAIAMAMLGMVLLTNSAVMYWQSAKTEDVATLDQPQPVLTEEYTLASSFYDDENP